MQLSQVDEFLPVENVTSEFPPLEFMLLTVGCKMCPCPVIKKTEKNAAKYLSIF